jgi:16S rRNA processing protein RimM
MTLLTDYPDHLLTVPTLYLGAHRQPRRVARMRRHRDGMVVLFDSVADRDQAELLRDQEVFVHIDDAVPLEEGEYYLFELQGIRVVADTGEELGRLTGVLETGANDVYVVTTGDNQELLLPVIPQVILKVDIPGGLMIVHLLEGLR